LILVRHERFDLHNVQPVSGANPIPYTMGTAGCFPEGKGQEHEADQSPPSSAEIKNGGAIPPFPRHLNGVFFFLVCETIATAATPGLLCQPRVIVKMIVESRWKVDWQGKPKFSEKTCPSATFVHHKIPHDQTRV
jgi:hypothetical protein